MGMTERRIIWSRLPVVLVGIFAFTTFLLFPILAVMGGGTIPAVVWYPADLAVSVILLRASQHYWIREDNDGRDSES